MGRRSIFSEPARLGRELAESGLKPGEPEYEKRWKAIREAEAKSLRVFEEGAARTQNDFEAFRRAIERTSHE